MVVYYVLAFLLGALAALIGVLRLCAGSLKVYIPDSDEPPYMCAELGKTIGWVCGKKYVMFRVDVRNIDSQK